MILLNLIASITFPNNEEKFHKIYGEYVLQPFRVGTESKKRKTKKKEFFIRFSLRRSACGTTVTMYTHNQ